MRWLDPSKELTTFVREKPRMIENILLKAQWTGTVSEPFDSTCEGNLYRLCISRPAWPLALVTLDVRQRTAPRWALTSLRRLSPGLSRQGLRPCLVGLS